MQGGRGVWGMVGARGIRWCCMVTLVRVACVRVFHSVRKVRRLGLALALTNGLRSRSERELPGRRARPSETFRVDLVG